MVEKLLPEHPEGNATNSNLSCLQEILRTHIGQDSDYETFKDEVFDSIYYFRKTQNLLIPNNNLLIKFKVNK